jgi:glyoxylase-like metal-dependent hydrolase (beta-lactamase superfamily II)
MTTAREQESALHYLLGDTLPAPGRAVEVAPGVRWLRMGLPFALDHINLWLLRDQIDGEAGWTVVDCGIDDAATRERWDSLFETELEGLPVLRVIVTHMHPDHIGLAHWLCERWSRPGHECRLWISATDWATARLACQRSIGFGGEEAAKFFALHGLRDPQTLDAVRARAGSFASLVPQVPARHRRLQDGMDIAIGGQPWHCIAGYGHAPEHIALHRAAPGGNADGAPGVLIAGDMVLPRISTNVSVIDSEPEGNPLPLYLASLKRLRELPAATLVLPSHGKPFTGLHTRIDQLLAHHEARYAEVLEVCAERACSAADLLPVMFRRTLDLQQTPFAMGEAVAHLHALAERGQLRAETGADGVRRFSTVG